MATKNLLIRGGADFSGMKRSMKDAQKSIDNFKDRVGSTMKGIGIAFAAAGAAISAAMFSGSKDAMEFEAHMGTLSQTLGQATKGFIEWMDTVGASLGYSRLQLAKYGNQYSVILKKIAKDEEDLAQKTQQTIQAGAILRTKTGMDIVEISDRLRSAMNGEADGADELGVNVRVAAIEASKAYKMMANNQPFSELSAEMQKAIRWQHTMNSITENFGNTMANNTSLKMSVFTSSLANLKLAMGQAWLPILNIALPALTKLSNAITRVMTLFAQFMSALFGYEADNGSGGVKEQVEDVNGLAEAYDKAGKAAKGSVSGFDEVNTLADKSSGGSGAAPVMADLGSGGMMGEFTQSTTKISEKAQEMADKVKNAFNNMSSAIVENKDIIISALAGLAIGFTTFFVATKWTSMIGGLTLAFNTLRGSIASTWTTLITPIALVAGAVALLAGAFIYFYRTNESFRGLVDGVLLQIKNVAIDLWENVLKPLGSWLATVFVKAWEVVKIAAEWVWKNVLVPFGTFLKNFYNEALVPLVDILKDSLGTAFQFVADVAKSLWNNVLVPLGNFLAEAFKPTVEAISAVLTFLWKVVIVPLAKVIKELLTLAFKGLAIVLKSLHDYVKSNLVPVLKDTLVNAFKFVGDVINGLKNIFIGLMKFITGVFTNDWRKAWEGVKQIFKGVFDSLWTIVKVPLNMIIDGINGMISGLNSIQIEVPDWVPGDMTSFGFSIPKLPRLARGGIVDGETNFGNYIAGEAGAEMIVPLENTSFTNQIAQALGAAVMNAMSKNNSGGGDIVLKVGETEFGRIAAKSINKAQRVSGNLLLEI